MIDGPSFCVKAAEGLRESEGKVLISEKLLLSVCIQLTNVAAFTDTETICTS